MKTNNSLNMKITIFNSKSMTFAYNYKSYYNFTLEQNLLITILIITYDIFTTNIYNEVLTKNRYDLNYFLYKL